jgi:DNA repair protein RecO
VYNIYTTKAIIIRSIPIAEANKLYFLLTEDFGLIKATAQGIRLSKSKLKGHLQDFYLSKIFFVKGRELWRITSSEVIFQENFLRDSNKIYIIKNIFSILLRLIHGEERNQNLFECVEKLYLFLLENNIDTEDSKNVETIVVLRILNTLGYLKRNEFFLEFCNNNEIDKDILQKFSIIRSKAILEINNSLKETHL